jgi:hypothetical protein
MLEYERYILSFLFMKKTLAYVLFSILCMHTTVSFGNAETDITNTGITSTGITNTGMALELSSLTGELSAILSSMSAMTGSLSGSPLTELTGSVAPYTSHRRLVSHVDTGELTLDAAPVSGMSTQEVKNYPYTSWELIHRTPMIAGFVWTGAIANFVTPQMYWGTPIAQQGSETTTVVYGQDTLTYTTAYDECVA